VPDLGEHPQDRRSALCTGESLRVPRSKLMETSSSPSQVKKNRRAGDGAIDFESYDSLSGLSIVIGLICLPRCQPKSRPIHRQMPECMLDKYGYMRQPHARPLSESSRVPCAEARALHRLSKWWCSYLEAESS